MYKKLKVSLVIIITLSCRTQVHELLDPPQVYDDLMNLIVRLGNSGVIHGDFNEFNLMVTDAGKPILIDFPQMMSTSHENAELYVTDYSIILGLLMFGFVLATLNATLRACVRCSVASLAMRAKIIPNSVI